MKADVWGVNNSDLIKEDYKSSLSAYEIANPEQFGYEFGIKEDYKSSSSEFGIANPEQHDCKSRTVR